LTDSESKRTAYLRAQMSLGERVEALECHVDNLHENKATVVWAEAVDDRAVELARRVDALNHEQGDLARRVAEIEHDRVGIGVSLSRLIKGLGEIESREYHFAGTDNDQSRHIADLQRRVAELEKGRALGVCEPPQAIYVDGSGEYIGEFDLARLRRIEEAARAVDSWDPILCGVNDAGMLADLHKLTLALRAALDSEPKR